MIINRLLTLCVIIIFNLLVGSGHVHADYRIGYFNGVFTTQQLEEISLYAIKDKRPKFFKGEAVYYHTYYNTSGSNKEGYTWMDDILEVFEQRAAELDSSLQFARRAEYLWEVMSRGSDNSFKGKINKDFPGIFGFYNRLEKKLDDTVSKSITAMASNPLAQQDYAEHNQYIYEHRTDKFMFVGHSQGNLFMNQSYNYVSTLIGSASVRVLHIAPPTTILNGDYLLNIKDIVIGALSILGGTPKSNLIATGYSDVTGHGFLEVYYNSDTKTSNGATTVIYDGKTQRVEYEYNGNSTLTIVNELIDKAMQLLIAPT